MNMGGQCMKVKSESEAAQSCLTRIDPMDCSLPGSSIHGIFQARLLEWGAIAFSTWMLSSVAQSCLTLCGPMNHSTPGLPVHHQLLEFTQTHVHRPCLFNFYAEYIMRNAGLNEAQTGIKIAGRNINNLRYADDTTLMAEREEELKSLFDDSERGE